MNQIPIKQTTRNTGQPIANQTFQDEDDFFQDEEDFQNKQDYSVNSFETNRKE